MLPAQKVRDGWSGTCTKSLSQKLRHPRYGRTIAVLLADTWADLEDILAIRALLDGIRIILILPDSNEQTVKQGFTLLPRFLTYADSDFSMAEAVLKKMLSNHRASQGTPGL